MYNHFKYVCHREIIEVIMLTKVTAVAQGHESKTLQRLSWQQVFFKILGILDGTLLLTSVDVEEAEVTMQLNPKGEKLTDCHLAATNNLGMV